MRISDWSSDVCSSDLRGPSGPAGGHCSSFGGAPDVDAVEKGDLDLDAGRHLDDGLVLFGAFDEVSADGVGSLAGTLAEATGKNIGRRQRLALTVGADLAGDRKSTRLNSSH